MNYLTDIIDFNLYVLFIGYNPGLISAETGHHYAGKNNSFWKLLYDSGFTPYKFKAEEDVKLLELGIGTLNIVDRPTKGISELTKEDFIKGSQKLKGLLTTYKPQVACYLGIGVYKAFSGKSKICCGRQRENSILGINDYVCSNPSGLNRIPYSDQLNCFKNLKEFIFKTDKDIL
ncbi:MAG: mug [Clostridiales bacterium]|jgi:TDG/mug DNA glycosylase family protein|nr:mug [Clostridiales bacterium]